MNNFYWKDGSQVFSKRMKPGSKRWLELLHELNEKMQDKKYKVVHQTRLWWGGQVSTVWLGIDYSFSMGEKPVIFETMVFPYREWSELDVERYTTLGRAKNGHWKMYLKWSNPKKIIKYVRRNLHE